MRDLIKERDKLKDKLEGLSLLVNFFKGDYDEIERNIEYYNSTIDALKQKLEDLKNSWND